MVSSLPVRSNSSRLGRKSSQRQQRQACSSYRRTPSPPSQVPLRRQHYVSPPSPPFPLQRQKRASVSPPAPSPRSIRNLSQRRYSRQKPSCMIAEGSYNNLSSTHPAGQTAIQRARSALDHDVGLLVTDYHPSDIPRARMPQVPSYEHYLAQARTRAHVAEIDVNPDLETIDSGNYPSTSLPPSLSKYSSPKSGKGSTFSNGRSSPISPRSSSQTSPLTIVRNSSLSHERDSSPRLTQRRFHTPQITSPPVLGSERRRNDSSDPSGLSSSSTTSTSQNLRRRLTPAPLDLSQPRRRRQAYQPSTQLSLSHPLNPHRNRLVLRPSGYIGHDAIIPHVNAEEEARVTLEANIRAMHAFTAVTQERGLQSAFSSDSESDGEFDRGRARSKTNRHGGLSSRNTSRASGRNGSFSGTAGGILRSLSRKLSRRGRKESNGKQENMS
jgi:hypothetical protein